jgi:hypothetical protein
MTRMDHPRGSPSKHLVACAALYDNVWNPTLKGDAPKHWQPLAYWQPDLQAWQKLQQGQRRTDEDPFYNLHASCDASVAVAVS